RRAAGRAPGDRHRLGLAEPRRQSSRCERFRCVRLTLSVATRSLCRWRPPPTFPRLELAGIFGRVETCGQHVPPPGVGGALEGLKILAMLPVRDVGLKPADFVATDRHIMIDKFVPQRL